MNNAVLINQTSGKVEYYTPPRIIEAARRTMGRIDLDPASSLKANETVKAQHIFTAADNGLDQQWFGNVWMNHPFGREHNPLWIAKLVSEYEGGNVQQACCITYACTSEQWFQPLLQFPICFLARRTNYLLSDGTVKRGVTKGSSVAYMGPHVERFICEFSSMGRVLVPARG